MVIFYTIPVAFAVSLANISSLAEIPFLAWLAVVKDYPFLQAIIEGKKIYIIPFSTLRFALLQLIRFSPVQVFCLHWSLSSSLKCYI